MTIQSNFHFSDIQTICVSTGNFRGNFDWNIEIAVTVLVGCLLLITSIIGVMIVSKVRNMRTNSNIRKVRTGDVTYNE